MNQIDFSEPEFQAMLGELVDLWNRGSKDEASQVLSDLEDVLEAKDGSAASDALCDVLSDIIGDRIGPRGLMELGMLQSLRGYKNLRGLAYTDATVSDENRAKAVAQLDEMEPELDEMELRARAFGVSFQRPLRKVPS